MDGAPGHAPRPSGRRVAPTVAWLLALCAVGVVVLSSVVARALGGLTPTRVVGEQIGFLLFVGVGAAIVARRPGNAVGWVMIGGGTCFLLDTAAVTWVDAATAGWDLPGVVWAAWLGSWIWSPGWGLTLGWLPFLFPDGRPLTRRWRWLAGLLVVGSLQAIPAMLVPQLEYGDDGRVLGPNPIGLPAHGELLAAMIDGVAMLYVLLWVAIVVMQAVRYRRADEVGRLQLRWFLFGIVVVIGGVLLTMLGPAVEELIERMPFSIAVASIPISVGIAVTRHRLYEIDRIISRTVAYALLAALLAALYLGSVLALGGVASALTGESGDLVVALSTLAVAAVFQPLRRRVQAVVDRRFNRGRYDAERVVAEFGRTLRDEVSLDVAVEGLRRVAVDTIQPTATSVLLVERRTP